MVIVPMRCPLVSAATVYPTVPLPLPEAPEAIVIHAALLTAVHPQPAAAVTGTVPAPPAAGAAALDGLSAATQFVVKDHAAEAFAPSPFLAPTAQ
jgi:hypothetical protein